MSSTISLSEGTKLVKKEIIEEAIDDEMMMIREKTLCHNHMKCEYF